MSSLRYRWKQGSVEHSLELVSVPGTDGVPFLFGEGNARSPIEVRTFFLATVPVGQALWAHVMGTDSVTACRQGENLPMENVSWNAITASNGFLDRINSGAILGAVVSQVPDDPKVLFRLPTETEWEYAARGGPHWKDEFQFSGGNDIDSVAWFKENSGDRTHDMAGKKSNQLGLFDMSGNVWEWCQDCYTEDTGLIPADGSAFVGTTDNRVLRGGCFHNWAIHCTVSKRYQIARPSHDGCIGFRLALSPNSPI